MLPRSDTRSAGYDRDPSSVEEVIGSVEAVSNGDLCLETAQTLVEALSNPIIAQRWEEPCALEGYTVGGLAAHTARSIRTVLIYLDGPEPAGTPISAAQYFLNGLRDEDPIDSELHLGIRRRAADAAANGSEEILRTATADLSSLTERLRTTADRTVEVFGGATMVLSEYLITRLVEMVVHLDDLAHSIGSDLPEPPGAAIDLTLATLFEMAVARHGPAAMLRALSREERSTVFPRAF